MIWIRSCLLQVTAPDDDGDRRWNAWVEVENKGASYEKSQIGILMRDGGGAVLDTEESYGEPIPPGVHLLNFGLWPDIKSRPASGECTLVVRRLRGLEPVRVEAPTGRKAPPLSVVPPVSSSPEEVALEDEAAPSGEVAPLKEVPAEDVATPEAAAPLAPPKLVEPAASSAPVDPWSLVSRGDRLGAVGAFEGLELDTEGREKVRRLMRSIAADDLVLACSIARVTLWRSVTTEIRRLVHHGHSDVRAAAAEALGVLGGPALVPVLSPLLNDRDERVRVVAEAAIQRLGG